MKYEQICTMLERHYQATKDMFDALEAVQPDQYLRMRGGSFGSIRNTAVHIFAAEQVWYSRWKGVSPTALVRGGTFPDLPSLRLASASLEIQIRRHVEEIGSDGINSRLEYTTLAGQATSSVFWHTIQHMILHGTYHRGQITTLLRQSNQLPGSNSELVAFYRLIEQLAAPPITPILTEPK